MARKGQEALNVPRDTSAQPAQESAKAVAEQAAHAARVSSLEPASVHEHRMPPTFLPPKPTMPPEPAVSKSAQAYVRPSARGERKKK